MQIAGQFLFDPNALHDHYRLLRRSSLMLFEVVGILSLNCISQPVSGKSRSVQELRTGLHVPAVPVADLA